MAGAIAPGRGSSYFGDSDQGFIDAVSTAVHDTNLKPSIISISWGGPEDSWTEQSRDALNSREDASTMGVTVFGGGADVQTEAQVEFRPWISPLQVRLWWDVAGRS